MTMTGERTYDVFIIGGGINGCGIARDAAGRGYTVGLCEAGDLGSGTSSASTKLIHGGLRYLEHYEFRLVREALKEREVIWQMAPHIVRPMRFILPHHSGMRPWWMLRIGLFLYDHLGGRKRLPGTTTIDLQQGEAGQPLKPEFRSGFEYSDCWVEDSRLVILNAMDAAERGAEIATRTRVVSATGEQDRWRLTLEDQRTGEQRAVTSRIVINAAGPWVDMVLRSVFGMNDAQNVRLVRGSHIVVRQKFAHDKCYIFQNADNRIIFAIPYEKNYTLIGTTDAEQEAIDGPIEITPEEIDYLCAAASEYFNEPVLTEHVVWTYAGVRPLYDDGATAAQEATRDYVIKAERSESGAPLINIFGGKITTYRKLAEAMLEEIGDRIGERGKPWTKTSTLPGGEFPVDGLEKEVADLLERHPFLDAPHAERLIRFYGRRSAEILKDVDDAEALGSRFGSDLHQREVDYLMQHEWAETAEDILFRRTKIGIELDESQTAKLEDYMQHRSGAAEPRKINTGS